MFRFMYDTDNAEMQVIGIHIAHFLSDKGYPSLPLPSSGWAGGPANVEGRGGRHGLFSHRHAAMLAGLGTIGLNNLLLTPKYGPRVRLNSVITTAEFKPDPILQEQVCLGAEKCGLCLKTPCFGEIEEWDVGGKKMPVAKLTRCNDLDPGCPQPEGEKLPFIRYCWGICPVGQVL
jgi:epoxyqueuosine reductase QueG